MESGIHGPNPDRDQIGRTKSNFKILDRSDSGPKKKIENLGPIRLDWSPDLVVRGFLDEVSKS